MSTLQSYNARSGEPFGEPLSASGFEDIDQTVRAADLAFAEWRASNGERRAALLGRLAEALETEREDLVALADIETALGSARLQGELDRTAFQLRRFADIARRGEPFAHLVDPAVAGGPPAGHPTMVRQRVPLGPVAMFAASNFPFAFSVLGGDTASALAAGCSVVVKAHPGHPQLSQRVHRLTREVIAELELPEGLVGMVQGAEVSVGVGLIRHPAIAAAAFTGSTRGGAALQAEAQARPRPIPFYGELGSINPVVALPEVLAKRGDELAQLLAGSITLGCGQFCTNPGLIVVLDAPATDAFIAVLADALRSQQPHPMLTQGMRRAYAAGVKDMLAHGATPLLDESTDELAPRPFVAQVEARRFIEQAALREEVFGPASLIVRAASIEEVEQVLAAVGGSLTVTLWGLDEESPQALRLVRAATSIAGRVLFAGVPTGVAVTAAQHHGGPWPASTAPMTTSVGDAAMERFLRPVALQDPPGWLLGREGRPC